MAERDSITQENISSVGPPTGDVLGAAGSVRVEDLQNQIPQGAPAQYPPPAQQQQAPPPDERQWMNYAQKLEYDNRVLRSKAEQFDRFDENLRHPETRNRFMQAWEYANNPNAQLPNQGQGHLSAAPPPAAGQPPSAAPPSQQAVPPQQQYQQPPQQQQYDPMREIAPVLRTLAERTERIEVQNAQWELQNKLTQMRGRFGAFDEMAVLEIAQGRNIQNVQELEDAYMTWDRYRKNAMAYGQPMQQYAPQGQPPQGYMQQQAPQQQQFYQQPQQQGWGQAPAVQPQYGQGYAPPPSQQQQVPRVIPPPTGSSVRSDIPQGMGNPNGPMSNNQRAQAQQSRYQGALQYARQIIPNGRN